MGEKSKKISLRTAQTWTSNWREFESGYNSYNKCNGFLVPAEDLRGVLQEIENQDNPQYIRAYLGVEFQLVDGKLKPTEKLVIVGTKPEQEKSSGKIIYRDLLPHDKDAVEGDGGGSVWDFSVPCPPDCDDESELN